MPISINLDIHVPLEGDHVPECPGSWCGGNSIFKADRPIRAGFNPFAATVLH
jgi:hypothetical protein